MKKILLTLFLFFFFLLPMFSKTFTDKKENNYEKKGTIYDRDYLIPNSILDTINSPVVNYTFSDVFGKNIYNIITKKGSCSFNSKDLKNAVIDKSNSLITEAKSSYPISGKITNGVSPVQGIVVTAIANGTLDTATTIANGTYSITSLPGGLDYTVSAAKDNTAFESDSATYTDLSANNILNLSAVTYPVSGVVKNGTTPVAGAKVQITLPWADSTHPYVTLLATTDSQGNYFFSSATLSGYSTYSSVLMNTWDNNSVAYLPTTYSGGTITGAGQVYNFNTQKIAPTINITAPTAATIATPIGTAIPLSASAGLTFNDGTTTVTGVVFNIAGQNITGVQSGSTYNATWTPIASQFSSTYTLTATATTSNSLTATATGSFYLSCTGTCPNQLPIITWNTPVSTTINQPSGFQAVPISIGAIDKDGSIASVSITVNGNTFPMTVGAGNTYTYNFTPSSYQSYPIVVTATDNQGGVSTYNTTIKVTNRVFIPLPPKVVVGYAQEWESADAPFLYFSSMASQKYNVVVYSFIQTANADGFTPQLATNDNRYLTAGVFNPQLLINDIQTLRSKGIPVIASIGGQNGHVALTTTAQRDIFVNGLQAIIDQYNFDGLDLDFEGASMSFGGENLTDFSYASISTVPMLKNVVDAFKQLKQYYGNGFILTAAPETAYVQAGFAKYTSTSGNFLPVLDNLRNELDLLMVQLYNTGSVYGLDNQAYSQATPDFLTSMSDMLIKGFNVASTGYFFNGYPASKIVVGTPACAGAAPAGGYIAPADGIKALDYLRLGTTFTGRAYTLQPGGPYPGLRGVMTWAINWDAACNNYGFANAYSAYLLAIPTPPVTNFTANKTIINPGASVTFTDSSTNTPTSWAWTFTGGTPATSTAQNPVVTYATAGTYPVSLIASNAGGSSTKTTTGYITVSTPPVANFSADKTTINPGGSVTFTDSSTNTPTSWAWTFTGGTPATSTAQNPVVTYATAGNYAVSLIATNAGGSNTKTTTGYITVSATPVANFSADKIAVVPGGSVTFTDSSTNIATSWAWTFTGGTPATSTAQNPVITYATAGSYAVSLIATNASGSNTKTATGYINVNPVPVANFSANKTAITTGSSVTFTDSSTNTPTSWAWTFTGGTPASSTAQNPVVTYATAGGYAVSLIATNASGSNTKTTSGYITVSATPVANFSSDKTIVNPGGSVTFTDSSTNTPTSWAWTFTGGTPATSTAQNPVVTYAAAGSYAVSLIATNASGSNTKTTSGYITVSTMPAANFSANKTAIATGSSVTFTDSSTNTPTSWAWTFTGGTPATSTAQNPVVTYATAGSYAVSLIAINASGSNTKTTSGYITVSTTPVANFSADKIAVVPGGSVTFTDSSTNTPTSWAWTFTGGTPATSTAQNPMVTYAAAGSYAVSLIATNVGGSNTKTTSGYITVSSVPAANFSANKTAIATGSSVTFTDSSTNTPTSWAWTFTGGSPATSTAQNPVVTYATAGSYAVSLVATNASGSNTKTTAGYITVSTAPVTNFSASKTAITPGSSVTFTDSSTNTPTSWAWTFTGGTPATSTAQNPVVTYATAGNYAVSLIATNVGGSNTKTTAGYIAVSAAPVANFSANKTAIPKGGSVTFTDVSANAPTSWAWTFTGGTPATSTAQNPVVTYAAAGNYAVSLIATNANGSNTKTTAGYITVNIPPVASFSADNTLIATGNSINFSDTSANAPASWAWTFAGGTPATSTVQNPVVTYAVAGSYVVSLIATNAAGTNTKTTANYITVNDLPITDFTADNTQVATGNPVTFTDASINMPTSWAWTFTGGTPATSTDENPVVTYTVAGSYPVSLTATNNVGVNTKTVAGYITVSAPPVAGFSADNMVLGAGATVNFTDSSVNTPTSWAWTFAGGTPATSTAQNPVVTYSAIGSYPVSLAVTNIAGTNTKTTANYININPAPVAAFNANKTVVAAGDSVTFTDASTNKPTSWVWTFTGGTPATSTDQNPVVAYATPGNYAVSLIATSNAGTNTKTTANYITVSTAPVAGFTADNTQVATGDPVTFSDTSINAPTSWAWTFAGGIPATSTDQNPVVSYATAGSYPVSLTVSNIAGTNTKTTAAYITASTAPVSNFSANKMLVSAGDSVTFSDASVNTPTSWAWTFTGGTPATSTAQNPVVTYANAGSYSVSLTATNSLGANTKTTTNYIIVKGVPVAGFNVNKTVIAAGDSVTFSDASTNGPTSWSWTFAGGTPATSTAQNPVVTYANAGSYPVSLTVTNVAGTNTKTTTNYITVNGVPVANFSANQTVVAAGTSVTFSDTSSNAPTSWAWTFTGGTPTTSTAQNPVITYAKAGNYSVSLTATNSLGSNTKNVVNYISVTPAIPAPVASFTANTTATTSGGTISFSDTSINAPTSWAWTFSGGTPSTSTAQNPVVVYASPGVYPVVLTATNSGGANTMTKTGYITINAPSDAVTSDNYTLSVQGETCINSNNGIINMTAKAAHAYTAVITATGFNQSVNFSVATPLNVTNLTAGTYSVCITIAGLAGYNQCFSVVVTQPQSLSVFSKIDRLAKKVSLQLSGSDSYRIALNDKKIVTSKNEITLDLDSNNPVYLSVSTPKSCQGVYEETIDSYDSPVFYPNPVLNTLEISIPSNTETDIEVPVAIYNVAGQQQISDSYKLSNGKIKLDLSQLPTGNYVVTVNLNGKIVKHKIVKR